ncbi:hypothetical protein [Alkalihalobacillus trypoxylicola]|uniref:hypothetical protein n=1 Tax=Alkalihalobacillus trypoxylicola TaxID=519424 RepID=UPI000A837652|nr:hypothetical protein [Alkalihalobacillus trypoxylicola]
MGARVFVQNNYFDNVGSGQNDPTTGHIKTAVGWYYGSPQTGYWNLTGNQFINTPNSHLTSTTNFTPPYSFNAQSANEARQAVEQKLRNRHCELKIEDDDHRASSFEVGWLF